MISQNCGFNNLPAFRRDIDVVDPIAINPSFPTTKSTSQFNLRVQLTKGITKRLSKSFIGKVAFSSIKITHKYGSFIARFPGSYPFKTKHGAFFSGGLTLMIKMGVVEEEGASCFLVLESSPRANTRNVITP